LVALGYFLNNQYSPFVEAWALKFSYDVDILVFFGHFFPKFGENFIQFSCHTDHMLVKSYFLY
jgi:hypothetical protein